MNKQWLVYSFATIVLLLAACTTPGDILSASAASSAVSVSQPAALPIKSTQSLVNDNSSMAYLNEAQVVFLLACRCPPKQLPR
jgi:hypothetical protein